jgi:predicted PolB exonuclease-like 3'-5' exonuclease
VSSSFLVVDIETVLDPELSLPAAETDRLPPPPHHRVVVIGALLFDATYAVERLGTFGEGDDEALALLEFSEFLERREPLLVTYNGRGFDMPVIATRCLRYGIPLRHYYRSHDVRHRFTADGHLDLMDYVADFGAARASRLDVIAKLCGLPGKVGIDGKDVAPLVAAGRVTEVRDYCLCDVVQTAALFLRVQLLRGELERETYLGAMGRLIHVIRADERLAPVASALNEKRLLLEG